jgi:hypothetical protein
MLIPFGILSAAGAGVEAGDYELIESEILGSAASSVTFSNLGTYSSNYKHLQLRIVGRTNGVNAFPGIRFNGDTGTNYLNHILRGRGADVTSLAELDRTNAVLGPLTADSAVANSFGAIVFDLVDAYGSKFKTGRSLSGRVTTDANEISLRSQLWRNTDSITSLTIVNNFSDDFVAGSRFSLYGIKG